MPVSLDTCERKPYQKRKSSGFKNIRIRVEGASIELTRHRNEMPNRMISSCHCGRWFVIYLSCLVLPCIAICKWTEILVHIGYFSHLALGTQRRFPPKYIENNFQATQSTFRCLETHSKRRNKNCIRSVILVEFESFSNYKGWSVIFPQNINAI